MNMRKVFYKNRMSSIIVMLTVLLCSSNIDALAQTFECPKVFEDAKVWNSVKGSDTKRAVELKDKGIYKMDVNGSFEYVYIMTTTDSLSISTMRKIGFDFIARHFNVSNATRADIETSSPDDGIIFKGFIPKIGGYNSGFEYNQVDASIYLDIRFKPNRVRFAIKVEDYKVLKLSSVTVSSSKQVYVSDCFPINENSDHKKSYAMAFLNANSKCMNYAYFFLDYLNKNIKQQQPTNIEDW